MNEEALNYAYSLFSKDGYSGSLEDFKSLMLQNKEAVDYAHDLFVKDGYNGESTDFYSLVGFEGSPDVEPLDVPEPEEESMLDPLSDWIGGIWNRGVAQGQSVDEALEMLAKGSSASEEDIREYYESAMKAQSIPTSEGMKKFRKEYVDGGKDTGAFLSALGNNMSVIPQVFFESMISMFTGATENKAIVGAGAGVGAAAGASFFGVGAGIGAGLGAMSVAGGALESATTLTELMQEELKEQGLEFNPENIKALMSDSDKFSSIRNKAIARGGIIGTIDLISGGVAGKATGIVARTGKRLSKTAAAATGLAVEGVGGSLGEASARAAIGQEMDVAEIGLEGVAGFATAPISVLSPLMKAPKYKINNEFVTREKAYEVIESMTDDQIASKDFNVEIKNDEYLINKVDQTKKKGKIKDQNKESITDQKDLDEYAEKQFEYDKISNKKDIFSKKRAEKLKGELEAIADKYITPESVEATPMDTDVSVEPTLEEGTTIDAEGKVIEDVEAEQQKASRERVDAIIEDISKKTESKFSKKADPKKVAKKKLDNVLAYLQENSKLYEDMNDSEREQLVLKINKKFGFPVKSSPSIKTALGQKSRKVLVDEMAALKNQIRLEAKAAREAKTYTRNFEKEQRTKIAEKIKEVYKDMKLTPTQFRVITNGINNLNTFSDKSMTNLMDRIDKIAFDSEMAIKVDQAETLRSKIAERAKTKDMEANLSYVGKKFAKLNINLVSDLNAYLEAADKISKGLDKSRKYGAKLKRKESVQLSEVQDFIIAQQEIQDAADKAKYDQKLSEINEKYEGLTEDEIRQSREQDREFEAEKAKTFRSKVKEAFNEYKQEMLDNLSGLTDSQADIAKRFTEMDLDIIQDANTSLRILDAMVDFTANGFTGGMESIIKSYEGIESISKLNEQGFASKKKYKTGGLYNFWFKNVTSLPILFESIFNGQSAARKISEASGISDIANGAADAVTEANNIENSYIKSFNKAKANGKKFFSLENVAERKILAVLMRTVDEGPEAMQAEFDRNKGLLLQSLERYKTSDKSKARIEIFEKMINKLVVDSNNVNDVIAAADAKNKEAVEWWQNKWEGKYDKVAEVSLNVYNTILGKDLGYTPYNFSNIMSEDSRVNEDPLELESFDALHSAKAYDKKSGTLMQVTRPKELPADSFIDLFDFDSMNSYKMKTALTDINTAANIKKLNAFLKDKKGMDALIPDRGTRDLFTERIKNYIKKTRGVGEKGSVDVKKFNKIVNSLAKLGVSRALGGVAQYPKQLIPPLVNTLVNAGDINVSAFLNKDARAFLMRSGFGIANRGFQSEVAIGKMDENLAGVDSDNLTAVLQGVDKVNNFYLKNFLVEPDKIAAQMSWLTYYTNGLKAQGIDTSNLDWANHEVNKEAGNYAQQQVDRQQNVSDTNMQGMLFASDQPMVSLARKLFFPFMNFAMNQKSRMYSDLSTLSDKMSSKEDKAAATRSLAGLATETVVFNSMSYAVANAVFAASSSMIDFEETEEEKEKRQNNLFRGRLTNIASDVSSPAPVVTDQLILPLINDMLEAFAGDSEDPLQLYEPGNKGMFESLGVLGIAPRNLEKLKEMYMLSVTGKYTDEFYGKKVQKELNSRGKESIRFAPAFYTLYSLGLAPVEIGRMAEYQIKIAKKQTKKKSDKPKGPAIRTR